jgi:hypothetical protein
MDSKTPSQAKATLLILAIFVMGFAGGALTMNLYQRSVNKQSNSQPREGGVVRGPLIQQMEKRLHLTPEQKNQIGAILNDTFGKYKDIREQMDKDPEVKKYMPQFDQTRETGRKRIREVLTKEQLPEYENMVKELDQERLKHEGKLRSK